MIGIVENGIEPVVSLRVLSPDGCEAEVLALVDTGSTEKLTLLSAVIHELSLSWLRTD